jgi:Mg-chelatase subunit ChlD
MRLAPGADRAAVVTFNSEVAVAAPLTHDREILRRAIDGVTLATGTRIDRAIERAAEVLPTAEGNLAAQRVIVLLTDGRPDGGTVEATLAAAGAAKARGVALFTIGLGDDVDADLLRRIASRPEDYAQAPDAAALQAIYESLAAALPCPGGAEWGGR